MKRSLAILLVVVFSAAALLAQSKAPAAQAAPAAQTAQAAPAVADPVVVAFGNTEIHKSELEGAIKTLPAEYQSYANGPGKRAFAEDYVRMKVLAAEAEKTGLDKTPEVAMQVKLMRDNALANAQLTQIEKDIKVSDADLQAAYDAKKDTFEQAKARHILIAFKGSPAAQAGKKELTEDEAKAKAESIREQLIKGADFAELAKKESDDPGSGARGGDLGSFGKGRMVPEFDKAVFEGKVGEILPLVRTMFGYHIIQVQERKTSTLDEVKAQLETELKQKKVQEKIDSIKESTKATYNDAYFATPVPTTPAEAAPKADQKPAPKH